MSELDDWRGLLSEDTAAARSVLSRVIVGRTESRPLGKGIHSPEEFHGRASIGGLLTGVVGVHERWRRQRDATAFAPVEIRGILTAA
jgi:hypothetical protein